MKHIDPYEVERRAVLALTLEPIAEKKGCTTRSRDTKSENLLEFYQENIRVGKSMKFETHVIWSKQFVQGLPVVRLMYQTAKRSIPSGLIASVEKAYKVGRKKINSNGIVADYTAAVIYLLLSDLKGVPDIV